MTSSARLMSIPVCSIVSVAKKSEQTKNSRLAENLNQLRWTASNDFELTHDEFDAALCALTGITSPDSRLEGPELEEEMWGRLFKNKNLDPAEMEELAAPRGYVLLKSKFGKSSLAADQTKTLNSV